MPHVKEVKDYGDLTLDPNNANKGTKRGRDLLDKSLENYGAGRSGLISADGVVLAGNKTVEAAIEHGLPIQVIKSDGTKLILVQRTDLNYDDPRAKELGIADNRVAELDLEWDAEVLKAMVEVGNIKVEEFFFEKELTEMFENMPGPDGAPAPSDRKLFTDDQLKARIFEDFPGFVSAADMVRGVITRAMAMGQFNKLHQGAGGSCGYYISALFNPHRFSTPVKTKGVDSKGLLREFNENEKFKQQGARYITQYQDGDMHPDDYIKYAGVGWGNVQFPNEFRPTIARDVYRLYCPPNGKVLDPCHGWGGRVTGFLACDIEGSSYLGYDPSTETSAGVTELIAFLKTSTARGEATVVKLPFEDAAVEEGVYDLVFTSPPYYDTERYSDDEEQSFKRYESFDAWVAGFYKPFLEKSMRALKPGGKFILNVGNNYFPLSKIASEWAKAQGISVKGISDFKIGRSGSLGEKEGDDEDFLLMEKK